jgi:alpha-glucosidase
MQWSHAPNAGFSPDGVRTWLPVNPNYAQGINVAQQQGEPGSMLSFYKQMLRLRKRTPALIDGDYTSLHQSAEDYFAFLRRSQETGQTCLVVLNLSERPQTLRFDLDSQGVRPLFSTHTPVGESLPFTGLNIAPFEVFIGELNS